MESLLLIAPQGPLIGSVNLPLSKSECNRALALQFLSKGKVRPSACSMAEDSQIMQRCLAEPENPIVNVGDAGTAMRFLTALFAFTEGERQLTGSMRMQERPIGILVDALNALGADIYYMNHKGFPPLFIKGKNPMACGGKIQVSANVSSQFISALAMVGPILGKGLQMNLVGGQVSTPYFEMTLAMMRKCGIEIQIKGQTIDIPPQHFNQVQLNIESDWSSAAYFIAMAALRPGSELTFQNLFAQSLQSDAIIMDYLCEDGMQFNFNQGNQSMVAKSIPSSTSLKTTFDFLDCPDLLQTIAVYLACIKTKALFTGFQTLKIKETDRVKALMEVFKSMGVQLIEVEETLRLDAKELFPVSQPLPVFNDHRMAMALSILSLNWGKVHIQNPEVVNKSFPHFWAELSALGFQCVRT